MMWKRGDRVTIPGYNGERITGEIVMIEGYLAHVECGESWTVRLADLAAPVVPPLGEGDEELREDADGTEQHGENPTGRR